MNQNNNTKKSYLYSKAFSTTYLIITAIIGVALIFMPPSGENALVVKCVETGFWWLVLGYGIIIFLQNKEKINSTFAVYVIIAAVTIFCLFQTKNIVLDTISEPSATILTNIEVYKRQKIGGIARTTYRLSGWDEKGEKHVFDITEDIYDRYNGSYMNNVVMIKYHRNTEALISISSMHKSE